MKKIFLILFASVLTTTASAQKFNSVPLHQKNSLQVELGGHGLFYSINYERIILNGNKFKLAAQAGFSYYPPSIGAIDYWIPVSGNGFYSMGKHHIEAGLGIVPAYSSIRDSEGVAVDWEWIGFWSFRIGYRYQKPGGRFVFRAGFTPVIETSLFDRYIPRRPFNELHPLGGMSFGYCF